MHTLCPRLRIMLLVISMMMSMLVWGQRQNRGQVAITATPERICDGGFSVLQAVATSVIDFETGDFSQYAFQNTGSYPWVVVSTETMDGSVYCMRSNNAGIHSSTSTISATHTYDAAGSIRFDALCMGEGSYTIWDACTFSIDGSVMFSYGANVSGWNNYGFNVSAGSHTFTWSYSKDGSAHPSGDAFFVDNIIFSSQTVDGESFLGQTYDFENGSFQGWTNIDADGDNNGWKIGSNSSYYYDDDLSVPGHNNSSHCVYSESFVFSYYDYYTSTFYGDAVTPNNYLVSPSKITIHDGAFISFWACGVSITDHTEEHFGVAISTKNYPTNSSDFTTIQEWTLTNTSGSYQGWPYQTAWRHYTVDLSAYAGQSIWVAIRHFNCYYRFYLGVDDISLYEGSDDPGGGGGDDDITYHWEPINQDGQSITVWPTETTTYTVTATDGNGTVIGVAQQTVVVEPFPVVSITTSTGETSICEDDIITLYASVSGTDYIMPGDILCTDESIVHPSDWPNGKTAKAIVFYVDATGQHGWAIDLVEVPSVKWSTENKDIPGLQSKANFFEAITDLDGYSNTQKIRSFNNDPLKYPAAWAVNFDQGWYLPSIGQLNILFGAYFAVNAGLEAVGGTTIYVGDLWSSNTYATDKAWVIRISNGQVGTDPKKSPRKVRAVIDF